MGIEPEDFVTPTITVMLKGGLGNQMFQYALGAELALQNELPLKLDCSRVRGRGRWSQGTVRDLALHELCVDFEESTPEDLGYLGARYYNSWDKRLLRRTRSALKRRPSPPKVNRSKRITIEASFEYDSEVFTPYPDGQYLDGYWQSPRYFTHVAQELRAKFQPRNPLGRSTCLLLKEIQEDRAVCLMVRRGEYARDRRVRRFHGLMDSKYYEGAAEALLETFGYTTTYIFSDDIPWCEANLRLPGRQHYVSHEHAGPKYTHYLSLMSACSAFIIPNSSFGWWAAWLADVPGEQIVAPRRWFADDEVVTTDLIPADWRRL